MKKLQIKKVFLNPEKGYSLVDQNDPSFIMNERGDGFLVTVLADNKAKKVNLKVGFIADGADKPVWTKKLKEFGITITSDMKELEIEFIDEEQFSYKHYDGTYTIVPSDKVFLGEDNKYFAVHAGILQDDLKKRSIKKFTIQGVNVGNEYIFNKILGFEKQEKK